MIAILIAVAAATFLVFVYINSDFRRRKLLLNKFPHPEQHFLTGNVGEFKKAEDFLQTMTNLLKKYGKTIYFQMGPLVDNLVTSDPKLYEFYLGNPKLIEKSRSYDFLHRWLGFGLLNSSGARWKHHRKIITPTFHFKILEQFVDVYDSAGNVLLKCLEKEVGKNSCNLYPYMNLFTLDVICETAMGLSVDAQVNSDSAYVNSVKALNKIVLWRDMSLIGTYEFTYKFTENYRKELKCLEVMHGFTNSVIKKRKEELEKNGGVKEETNEFGIKKKLSFLDLLLQTKNDDGNRLLSDEEIREEVDTFMFAGHDTTSGEICFTLYNIANHPDVQENLVRELNEIFEDDPNRPITYNDLQQLKYLEAVIKETMRIFPSAPMIARYVTEDLEYDGKIIPKGTNVQFFFFATHRDEDNYPDPLKFDPNRFLSKEKQNPYIFVPFSAGPRNCIGQKFAMLEMKTTVAKVVRKYELLPAIPNPEPILVPETVLVSSNGNNVRLKLRKQ